MDFLQRLPEDLVLQEIFPRLDSTSRIRSAAVSRSWRDLSRRAPRPIFGGFPWMWLSDKFMNHSLLQPPLSSSSSATTSSFKVMTMAGKTIVGTHGQYALIIDDGLIYDPFARRSFQFPSIRDDVARISVSLPPRQRLYTDKFQPNLVAAAAANRYLIMVYRPDLDDYWKVAFDMDKPHDLIFHKDELYCVNRDREIKALHIRTPNLPSGFSGSEHRTSRPERTVVLAREYRSDDAINYQKTFTLHHLVESCRGELLLVSRYDLGYKKIRFEVNRVLEEGGLAEVVDLGDDMLFVREGCSRSWSGWTPTTLLAHDEFFVNNSIYFFHMDKLDGEDRFSLGKFSLSTTRRDDNFATFHPVPLPSAFRPYWITPNDT